MLLQQEVGFDIEFYTPSYSSDPQVVLWACIGALTLFAMSRQVQAAARRLVGDEGGAMSSTAVPERFENLYFAFVAGVVGVSAMWLALAPVSFRVERAPGEVAILWLSCIGYVVAPILLLSSSQRVAVRIWANEEGTGILCGGLVGALAPLAWMGRFDWGAIIGFLAVGLGIGALNYHVRSLPWSSLVWFGFPIGTLALWPVGQELLSGAINSVLIVAQALRGTW